MDAGACRESLGAILVETLAALQELATTLEREHQLLESNEVATLHGAMRERQRTIARVVRLDEGRERLCREAGHTADPQGLQRLFAGCDPHGTLAGRWAQCAALAAKCRALNDRNATLVTARLRHVQARLTALVKGRRETVTYGRRGGCTLVASTQVVATEA
ncbi:MAG: flagella synthesis protein FlgN [Steroidobacteraceae bacterium]